MVITLFRSNAQLQTQCEVKPLGEFLTQDFSSRWYSAEESIAFSNSPHTHLADIEQEMQYHTAAKHIQVSGLTQTEFDVFVWDYADRYESIYFFQDPQIKDLSALLSLRHVQYLLLYNMRAAKQLWDMQNNVSLKGLFISNSRNLVYDLSPIAKTPVLEELLLLSGMDRKYTVQTLEPIRQNPSIKRVMLECRTEHGDFDPDDFSHLEFFRYQVDRKRNDR